MSSKKTVFGSGLLLAATMALSVACRQTSTGNGGTDGGGAKVGDSGTIPTDSSGFTVLTPSADSHVIYVSSSLGNDANDGSTEAQAVKSVARAIGLARDGYPDHILFRKGDVWHGGLGNWVKSGRSATERMVVSSYGTGDRPTFLTGPGENGLYTYGGSGTPPSRDYVAFVGLHFYASTRDPASADWQGYSTSTGIQWLQGTRDLLVEDCVIQSYSDNVVFQAGPSPQTNIVFRRNLVLDNWDMTKSQGIYTDTASIELVENVIIAKGWEPTVSGSEPTIYSHAIYVQANPALVSVVDNVILNGTSHGLQLRSGGIAQGNLFAHNAIGMLLGSGDYPAPGVNGSVADNVILDGTDISSSAPRAWGIDFVNIESATTSGNIVAHALGVSPGTPIATDANTTYANNLVNDWGSAPDAPTGPFVDSKRSLEGYNASLGGPGTYVDFMAELRKQSKDRWRSDYTAHAVNAYIRAGFAAP